MVDRHVGKIAGKIPREAHWICLQSGHSDSQGLQHATDRVIEDITAISRKWLIDGIRRGIMMLATAACGKPMV
jgi:hypothetical protein